MPARLGFDAMRERVVELTGCDEKAAKQVVAELIVSLLLHIVLDAKEE